MLVSTGSMGKDRNAGRWRSLKRPQPFTGTVADVVSKHCSSSRLLVVVLVCSTVVGVLLVATARIIVDSIIFICLLVYYQVLVDYSNYYSRSNIPGTTVESRLSVVHVTTTS